MQKIKLVSKAVTLNQTMIVYNLSEIANGQFHVHYQLLSDKGTTVVSGRLLRQASEYPVWAAGNSADNLSAIGTILAGALEVAPDTDQTMPLSPFEKAQSERKAKQEKRKGAAPAKS